MSRLTCANSKRGEARVVDAGQKGDTEDVTKAIG
jgi:hypothetical protein